MKKFSSYMCLHSVARKEKKEAGFGFTQSLQTFYLASQECLVLDKLVDRSIDACREEY